LTEAAHASYAGRALERSTRLASAPVTWGVWERTTGRDDLVPPGLLIETVAGLGYPGIELGPPDYFDPTALTDAGLELVGGFAPLHLVDEDAFRDDLAVWLDPIVDALLATGARGPVVLADAETDERLAGAGRPTEQARTALSPDAFKRAMERVERAADRCRARGVDVVFHHHAATYIETPEDIAALLEGTDVGICFDTGHAAVGGGDPLEVARMCGERIAHLHLKDVDPVLLGRVAGGEVTLEEAWGNGLFCPFGEGLVDFRAVLALPALQDFDGWIVLEQDRVAVRTADLEAVRRVEEANLRVVREALDA
jgi:inosose dehydratase